MDIVIKLRELRSRSGFSQKDVGRLSGVGEKTLSSFESGARIDSLKLSQLRRLLCVYSITEEAFFSRKMDELFDPYTLVVHSREESLVAALRELTSPMRDALLERFELMLHAAQLSASEKPKTTPIAPAARPASPSWLHAFAR
jgi:transcriptional regulator with XRE-family HTH domain